MSAELDFTGKTVLVVGGSSGIGNGIAQRFRRHGAEVHVWGTRRSADDYVTSEDSDLTGLHYAQVDVCDRSRVAALVPPFDRLDVLVQSQGVVLYGGVEFEAEGWDEVIRLNLDSVMDCARKFHRMLSTRKGAVVIVSSVSGFLTNSSNPAYSASKAAAVSLTRSLGRAWARGGIRVNGIAPGLVDTKLTKVATDDPHLLARMVELIPAGYVGLPDEMGRVALFLASDLASYVVGQTIVVDGGLTISRALDAALAK
jgi:3-oxoacyl-[acyl-carrier protein] reductase